MGVSGENECRRCRPNEPTSPTGPNDEFTGLPRDDIFHLLQTKRRRDVLRYLQGRDGQIELRYLAEQVAAWEQETSVESLTSSQRQRVYISLYQTHLPKLDEHGVLDYDKDRGLVERRPRADHLESYLDVGTDEATTDPWPRRYGLTVVACCVLFCGAVLRSGFSSTFWITAVVLGAVGTVTTVHWWSTRASGSLVAALWQRWA